MAAPGRRVSQDSGHLKIPKLRYSTIFLFALAIVAIGLAYDLGYDRGVRVTSITTALRAGAITSPANTTSTLASNLNTTHTTTTKAHDGQRSALKRPLWWFAPFYTSSSFGHEAATYMLALKRVDLLVNASRLHIGLMQDKCDYDLGDAMSPVDHADLESMRGPPLVSDPPAVVVCHNGAWHMALAGGGRKGCQPCPPPGYNPAITIVRAMTEADLVLGYTIAVINQADEVWVPTQFSAEAMRASGLTKPIRILPQGFNTTYFNPAAHTPAILPKGTQATGRPRPPGKNQKPFVFVSVFKWETRKGWDLLLEAYFREFVGSQDVELYIVTHPWGAGTLETIVKDVHERAAKVLPTTNLTQLPPVYIIADYVSIDDLARLYRASDCFVLPTHGEGWGRPPSEAMAMGLPAIVTNWSGPTEFMSEATGYPLRYTGLTLAEDNSFNNPKGKWAQPDMEHLRQLMRQASSNPQEAKRKGQAARELMVRKFSLEAVALKLVELLGQVEADLASRQKPKPAA